MRPDVHCYALHCLGAAASDALHAGEGGVRARSAARTSARGGRPQACYTRPLADITARHGFDIDAVFAARGAPAPRSPSGTCPQATAHVHGSASSATRRARSSHAAAGPVHPLVCCCFGGRDLVVSVLKKQWMNSAAQ
ncbi:hypothetical protein GUJ93_ZPchr0004g38356 [Zizania palustris]|uniref:Floricaula/leafy-like transcription factor n=1 Tax=Zizania palustris TaxID=103762 RepID=A0A8J5S0R0_ZIZPA|nr:hypothetical protein GUJ93_ZPchr0004g38356 [Zizania palustris]